jgi:tRNA threonylcarbamoyladenosine biosynthesis protein TsaE
VPGLRRWRSASVDGTREVGRSLAAELAPDGALLVSGGLGAGKTVLAQGVAAGLGIDPDAVQSPAYTLLAEHRGPGGLLRHFDLYRLSPDEVRAAGFEEQLLGDGVKVVEWPERLPFALPAARRVRIERAPDGWREIEELASSGEATESAGPEAARGRRPDRE